MIKLTLTQSIYALGPVGMALVLPAIIGGDSSGVFLGYLALSGLVAILLNLSFDGFIQREILHRELNIAARLIKNRLSITLFLAICTVLVANFASPGFPVLAPLLGATSVSIAVTTQGALRSSGRGGNFLQFALASNVFIPVGLFCLAYIFRIDEPDLLFECYTIAIALVSCAFLSILLRSIGSITKDLTPLRPFVLEGLAILPHTIGLYVLLYSDRLSMTLLQRNAEVTELARASIPSAAIFALIAIFVGPLTKSQFSEEKFFKNSRLLNRILFASSAIGLLAVAFIHAFLLLQSDWLAKTTGFSAEFLRLTAAYFFIPLASISYSIVGSQIFMKRGGRWYGPLTVSIGFACILISSLAFVYLGEELSVFPLFMGIGYSILSLATLVRANLIWGYKNNPMVALVILICVAQVVFWIASFK